MAKKKLVVFTGAGMSAESGIQTFRDADGLWEGHKVEEVASPDGWNANPQLVLDFYNKRHAQLATVEPNAAHIALAELEKDFEVIIVTQNVDDLHERAGSTKVVHLHGQLMKKQRVDNPDAISDWPIGEDITLVNNDEIQFRPHIVWFGESVPNMNLAYHHALMADAFVVIGTSLQVYPAAGIVSYVPPFCPKFIVDKKIPEVSLRSLTRIEKSAVEGIEDLKKELAKLK